MTKIKLCGLTRYCDIDAVNITLPDYIGFVFSPKSRRFISSEQAVLLKKHLDSRIKTVGVFVKERPQKVAELLNSDIIDIAQLHGGEGEEYIQTLRMLTEKPIIKAFRVETAQDVVCAEKCSADYVLLDSGTGGTGTVFDWKLLKSIDRPYFLAGGLDVHNVQKALNMLDPYAVDVSSGIETNGVKDMVKIKEFVSSIRERKTCR